MKRLPILTLLLAVGVLSGCATTVTHLKIKAPLQREAMVIDGVNYFPVIKVCQAYGLEWKWDGISKVATLKGKGGKIAIMAGSDEVLVNSSQKKLRNPVVLRNSALYVPVSFVKRCLAGITSTDKTGDFAAAKLPTRRRMYTIKTIVIDAGHGGKDPGARSKRYGLREKDLNLLVAKKMRDLLEENGINVIMTREDDRFISLRRRAEIANKAKADLFVSIHTNASPPRSRWVHGFECYYLSNATDDHARALAARENASLKYGKSSLFEHSTDLDTTLWDMELSENRIVSRELAAAICDSVRSRMSTKASVKSARFYVLKWTCMPAVLVEMGYLSNRFEERKLRDRKYLNRMTRVLVDGILAYKREYEKTNGFTD